MSLTDMGILAALALVDSTSVGTLVIPLWLLVRSKVNVPALLGYLGTLAAFYWTVGLVLLLGGERFEAFISGIDIPIPIYWVQLVVGVGLALWGLWVDEQPASDGLSPRLKGWQEKTLAAAQSPVMLGGLALVAGLFELATMLPYLAALSHLGGMDISFAAKTVWLVAYVVLMSCPALTLLGLRLAYRNNAGTLLLRIEIWVTGQSKVILSTALIVVGAFLSLSAAQFLGFLEF